MSPIDAPPRLELICVGSELLNGKINTHQSSIAVALSQIGLNLSREISVPDEIALLTEAITGAIARADAVLISGGLGPTFDDITREATSQALNRELIYHPKIYTGIKEKFRRYKVVLAQENARQAYVIQGAQVLKNDYGSAPGQLLLIPGTKQNKTKLIALMPGPYTELFPIFSRDVLPRLKQLYAPKTSVASLCVHLSGIPESLADEKLKFLTRQPKKGENFTILAGTGQVDFYATVTAPSSKQANQSIRIIRQKIYKAVGKHIFGEGSQTLESVVGNLLSKKKLTVSVAESCTAGMLAARLTNVPGSSTYFKGGAIVYSNELKKNILGISQTLLNRHGAVSKACAAEMAQKIRLLADTSIGISITGIAGPGGATTGKPVGLVYIAIAGPKDNQPQVWEFRLTGSREIVRARAVALALTGLKQKLQND